MFAITKNEYFAVSTANKSQELVIISKRDCTVWNKILALLGFGPLKNRDFRPTSVAAYLGSHFLEELKNKYSNKTVFQEKINGIALKALWKGQHQLFAKVVELRYGDLFKDETVDCKYSLEKITKPETLKNTLYGVDQTTQKIVKIDRKKLNLFNNLLAILGLGPLSNIDLSVVTVANQIAKNYEAQKVTGNEDFLFLAKHACKKGSFKLLDLINNQTKPKQE